MNNTHTISINGTDYKVRFSLKAIKLFEDLAKKSITQSQGTWDDLLFFFATIKALNPSFEMSLDEFEEYVSTHTDLLIKWQTASTNPDAHTPGEDPAQTDKKKVKLSGLWMLSLFALVFMLATPIIFGITSVLMSCWGIIKLIIWPGKKLKQLLKRSAAHSS